MQALDLSESLIAVFLIGTLAVWPNVIVDLNTRTDDFHRDMMGHTARAGLDSCGRDLADVPGCGADSERNLVFQDVAYVSNSTHGLNTLDAAVDTVISSNATTTVITGAVIDLTGSNDPTVATGLSSTQTLDLEEGYFDGQRHYVTACGSDAFPVYLRAPHGRGLLRLESFTCDAHLVWDERNCQWESYLVRGDHKAHWIPQPPYHLSNRTDFTYPLTKSGKTVIAPVLAQASQNGDVYAWQFYEENKVVIYRRPASKCGDPVYLQTLTYDNVSQPDPDGVDGAELFGRNAHFSCDGNTLVVGASNASTIRQNENIGAVFVFEADPVTGVFGASTQRIEPTGGSTSVEFYPSGLSCDGLTLLFTSPIEPGVTEVYVRNDRSSLFQYQQSVAMGINGTTEPDSVLAKDGHAFLIYSPESYGPLTGTGFVFSRTAANSTFTKVLDASSMVPNASDYHTMCQFSALSGDGTTYACARSLEANIQVTVYRRFGNGEWNLVQVLDSGVGVNYVISHLSISMHGNVMALSVNFVGPGAAKALLFSRLNDRLGTYEATGVTVDSVMTAIGSRTSWWELINDGREVFAY